MSIQISGEADRQEISYLKAKIQRLEEDNANLKKSVNCTCRQDVAFHKGVWFPKGKRFGREYYLNFLEDLFLKNQESPMPAKQHDFFNIAQEVWRELECRMRKDGAEAVFKKMRGNII